MIAKRQTILFVLSEAHSITGADGVVRQTGYWLEEFAVPYLLMSRAGLSITVATPSGHDPVADPASLALDQSGKCQAWDSDVPFEQAIALKEKVVDRGEIRNLRDMSEGDLDQFDAVFFPGGYAPMVDMMHNIAVGETLEHFHARGKPTALFCHAPIALLSTVNERGFIYRGYRATCFSESEEQAGEIGRALKFTAEAALRSAGMEYEKTSDWLPHIVHDRELITGQNTATTKPISEYLMQQLGV
jgi:putative intracellular protease/amidase